MELVKKFMIKNGDKLLIYYHNGRTLGKFRNCCPNSYAIVAHMVSVDRLNEIYFTQDDEYFDNMTLSSFGGKEHDFYKLTDDEFLNFMILTI